jgi:hypothetical protein
VSLDLKSLAIADFKGSGDFCNFRNVFAEMVKTQTIPFSFGKQQPQSDRLQFGNLQTAEGSGRKFPAAKLYVHRRNTPDQVSLDAGEGVLLDTVSVDFTAVSQGLHYVQISGQRASLVN